MPQKLVRVIKTTGKVELFLDGFECIVFSLKTEVDYNLMVKKLKSKRSRTTNITASSRNIFFSCGMVCFIDFLILG